MNRYIPNPVKTVAYQSFDEDFQSLSDEEVIEMIRVEWQDFIIEEQDPDKAASQIIFEIADWADTDDKRKLLVLRTLLEVVEQTDYKTKEYQTSRNNLRIKLAISIKNLLKS